MPYLEVLNGATISMEHHVLANKKHGSEDDQHRLALRMFDDAFMACAVRRARAALTFTRAVSVVCLCVCFIASQFTLQ